MATSKPKKTGPGPKIKLFPKKPYKDPMNKQEYQANNDFTDRRMKRIGGAVTAATLGTTAAALLNTPGGRKFMKNTKEKVVNTVKNIRGTGEYVSDPDTGKMVRVPKAKTAKEPKAPSKRSLRKTASKTK